MSASKGFNPRCDVTQGGPILSELKKETKKLVFFSRKECDP
jgi:hypothetical protein